MEFGTAAEEEAVVGVGGCGAVCDEWGCWWASDGGGWRFDGCG